MAKDFATSAITKHLKPLLSEQGFYRRNPKTFVRVRGELVDVISFQLSQYGSRLFYLHHYCNILTQPRPEFLLKSYQVGNRINHDPNGVEWIANNDNNAVSAMKSVANICEQKVLPWFDKLVSVKEWLIEHIASPNTVLESNEVAIALLLLGHTNRPWWILSNLSEKPIDQDRDIEQQQYFKSEAKKFANSIDDKSYLKLFRNWREEAIKKNAIEKAIIS